ncbi:MAG: sigma-54-dependent Fis family transcriptional regulator [Gemmatimonadales bacterium]|nr:MAG: sigma-54-dependent Fis family transcriptional regulator [Gemmatimonadales bacterium]
MHPGSEAHRPSDASGRGHQPVGAPARGIRVLVVDDDCGTRATLSDVLSRAGYEVAALESGEEALKQLHDDGFEVVLLQLELPRMSGMSVLSALPSLHTDARFITMTAFGSVESAVQAMRLGAYDYIRKPLDVDELLHLVRRAAEDVTLRRELAELKRITPPDRLRDLLGRSTAMHRLFRVIERVAPTRATVLIMGETGTGKELVAHALHDLSSRSRRSFVPVACSALPDTLLEAELFGFMKGSFTGALENRPGLIEQAAGGTLFLDEVSTLSEDLQVKLLRVIQDRKVQRVGGRSLQLVDFRLVAATNTDLLDLVRAGRFREDLFYRLNVFPIRVPPLRERRDDIPLLAAHFRKRFAEEQGVDVPEIPTPLLARMKDYPWPGNVRELEGFIERAVILAAAGEPLHFDLITDEGADTTARLLLESASSERWTMDELEREYILSVLEETRGRKSEAVKILGISRRTLYRKLARYREEGFVTADVGEG